MHREPKFCKNSFIAQRAKIDWLKLGEETSSIFYNGIKARRAGSNIFVLKDRDGNVLDSRSAVEEEIINFYKKLIGTDSSAKAIDFSGYEGPVVDMSDHLMLCSFPTSEAIRDVVFDIGNNKSPRPDGFGSMFFKRSWDLVKDDVCKAVMEFFRNGKMLKQFNATFVSLIPKVEKPFAIKELRPISCCNAVMKVISKILVQRIRPVLDRIVSVNQSAFVPGRNIAHNVVVAQELVKGYERKGISPRCMLQIDLQKAYDNVRWTFIEQALVFFQFPTQLIQWVMECVKTPWCSIIINGEAKMFFPGKRGLRQGDPLSPFLFVLVMEMFSRKLTMISKRKGFCFHPKCKQLGLVSIALADDLLIFCKPNKYTLNLIKEGLILTLEGSLVLQQMLQRVRSSLED